MFEKKNHRNEDGTINYEGDFERVLAILVNNSEIPEGYLNIELNEEERSAADELLVDPKKILNGYKLYLHSRSVGTGKTTLACYFLQQFITWYCKYKGMNSINCVGFFVNCRDYITLKKASFNNRDLLPIVTDMEDKMKMAPMVVFDEVCLPSLSDYDGMLIYTIMNYRDAHKKSSIFTSNYDPYELLDAMGASISRRILQGAESKEMK